MNFEASAFELVDALFNENGHRVAFGLRTRPFWEVDPPCMNRYVVIRLCLSNSVDP